MSWNTAIPAGTDLVRDGDDVIREFKIDVQLAYRANEPGALAQDAGAFPGANLALPKYHYRGLKGTTANRPTATHYGLYINTDTKTLQRSNGTTWEDVDMSGSSFPTGGTVKIPFYMAAAPLGWTLDTSVNDRFIRISDTAGGSISGAFSTLSHSHAHAHTHDEGTLAASLDFDGSSGNRLFNRTKNIPSSTLFPLCGVSGGPSGGNLGAHTIGTEVVGNTGAASTANTSAQTISHGSTQHAYADFIICSKD